MTAGCARAWRSSPAATYVFDRAYNKAEFWADIEAAEAFFVTRPKSNLAYDVHQPKLYPNSLIVADEIITLAGQPGRKYKKPLRRIEIFDEDKGREIAFITNDFQRSAEEVADLYKRRWQIELFFKWIKQNLKIKRFLAKNPKAIRLQIITAPDRLSAAQTIAPSKGHHHTSKTRRRHRNKLSIQPRRYQPLIKPPDRHPPPKPTNQLLLDFPGQ